MISKINMTHNNQSSVNIYIGCGDDRREGFMHCDIRPLEGVDIVCNAWDLSNNIMHVDQIYSRHMLEHLTAAEAFAALNDWYNTLSNGGSIYLVVPNLDFHIKQWLNANWNDNELDEPLSNASHALGGFYGWQRECDPVEANYNQTYWDVHKSGYNKKRMQYVLEKVGYREIELEIKNDVHLVARAIK